jgi:hypothetical protein
MSGMNVGFRLGGMHWSMLSKGDKLDMLRAEALRQGKIVDELLRLAGLREAECSELIPSK